MDKEKFMELMTFTYNRTLKDNEADFIQLYKIITKLCYKLKEKNILTAEEIGKILELKLEEE